MYAQCTVIIDIQYNISMPNHLHPKSLRPFSFCATTMHVIWVMNTGGPSRFSAFGWQFTAYRCIHYWLTNMARLPDLSVTSSSCSISMTYHRQFSKSSPCATALSGELCSWMKGLMRHGGSHSSGFTLRIDHSFFDSYDITDLHFVSKFCL